MDGRTMVEPKITNFHLKQSEEVLRVTSMVKHLKEASKFNRDTALRLYVERLVCVMARKSCPKNFIVVQFLYKKQKSGVHGYWEKLILPQGKLNIHWHCFTRDGFHITKARG